MSTPDTFTELLKEELAPDPDPRFAAEMDEWVAAGFPHREPRRRTRWLARALRVVRTPIGLAGASAALGGLLIAVLLAADATQQQTTHPPTAGSAPPQE